MPRLYQAPVTGESLPVDKIPGDEVFAGTINGRGALDVKVSRPRRETTLARIIHLVERDPIFTIFGIVASILFWCNSYRRRDDFAYYNILRQKSGLSGADTLQS